MPYALIIRLMNPAIAAAAVTRFDEIMECPDDIISVKHPDRNVTDADICTPVAFALAKRYRKNPVMIADGIVRQIYEWHSDWRKVDDCASYRMLGAQVLADDPLPFLYRIEAAGGWINVWINRVELAQLIMLHSYGKAGESIG